MSKHFAVGTPQPLGNPRPTVNSDKDESAFEKLAARVAETIAPIVAKTVAEQLKTQAKGESDKDDIAANLAQYVPPSDDDFDTLPEGGTQSRSSNGRKMPSYFDSLPD